ncbi:MAG: heme biosynthesis protein HemY [Pseudohongiellaceae bacterium]
MKLYIFSLLAIAAALLLSVWMGFPADPGYFLIAFSNYTFETSLFALLTAILILILLWRILLLIINTLNPWQLVRYSNARRLEYKARQRRKATQDPVKAKQRRRQTLTAGLQAAADEGLASLTKRWKKAPAALRKDAAAVHHYAKLLLSLNAKTEAAKVIETTLRKNWSDNLVLLYSAEDFDLPHQQLSKAERWLQDYPTDPNLLLSLGRICRRNELWGKARDYYEASIKTKPSIEAYAELSELLAALGHTEAAEDNLQLYRKATGTTLPGLPLPKTISSS